MDRNEREKRKAARWIESRVLTIGAGPDHAAMLRRCDGMLDQVDRLDETLDEHAGFFACLSPAKNEEAVHVEQ